MHMDSTWSHSSDTTAETGEFLDLRLSQRAFGFLYSFQHQGIYQNLPKVRGGEHGLSLFPC